MRAYMDIHNFPEPESSNVTEAHRMNIYRSGKNRNVNA